MTTLTSWSWCNYILSILKGTLTSETGIHLSYWKVSSYCHWSRLRSNFSRENVHLLLQSSGSTTNLRSVWIKSTVQAFVDHTDNMTSDSKLEACGSNSQGRIFVSSLAGVMVDTCSFFIVPFLHRLISHLSVDQRYRVWCISFVKEVSYDSPSWVFFPS